jgi:cupin superfamily acireductone dioxygenase involved in methionine salvage
MNEKTILELEKEILGEEWDAEAIIEELQNKVKAQAAEIKALQASRDFYQTKNAQSVGQINYWKKKAK